MLGTHPNQVFVLVRYGLDTGTRHFGKFGMTSIPIPDTRYVRYNMNTGTRQFGKFGMTHRHPTFPHDLNTCTRHFGKGIPGVFALPKWFGTTSIPRTQVKVRYDLNTGTRHLEKFGTTSIPAPDTSVTSVRPPKKHYVLVYPAEHTLDEMYTYVRRLL